jgi:hypothetical protein
VSATARRERLAGGLACLAVLLSAVLLAPGVALAVDVTFASSEAHAILGEPVTFREGFQSTATPERVELVTSLPGVPGSDVQTADVTSNGSARIATAQLDGHFRPNTTLQYRFRVFLAGGQAIEGPEATATVLDTRFDWHVRAGRHVTIHWYEAASGFGDRAVRVGDDAVDRAVELLGLAGVEPVDYFVYASSDALYVAMGAGTSDNVGGQYYAPIRTAYADIAPSESDSNWADNVITHELVHHVFDQATRNPYHEPPTWLNEGLAVFLAEGGAEARSAELGSAVRGGDVLPLEALADAFPRTSRPFSLAYAESVSAVAFLIERHGRGGLADLVKRYRAGSSDDEAFTGALGETAAAFGEAWLASIGASRPAAYGPQPAPAGPLPSEWRPGAEAATPRPAATGPAASSTPTGPTPFAASSRPSAASVTAVPGGSPGDGTSGRPGPWLLVGLTAVLVGVILVAVVVVERRRSVSRPPAPLPVGPPPAPMPAGPSLGPPPHGPAQP